jgi:sulfite reductase (NADPH) hemoprotein beta-component
MVRNAAGEPGFEVSSAAAWAARPMIGMTVRDFLPEADLLPYVEAISASTTRLGRRDNKYKARIKITVHETRQGRDHPQIEAEFAELRPLFGGNDQKLLADIREAFAPPAFRNAPTDAYEAFRKADPVFRAWADTNLTRHRNASMPSSRSA